MSAISQNILITGGAGFIGSHVVDKFISEDINVVVYDNFSYCASLNNVNEKAKIEHADIRNLSDVLRVLKKHQITSIVHLAAQSHVDNSFGNSLMFTDSNVIGTHVLLEAFYQHWKASGNCKDWRFLHISTDEVYGTNEQAQCEDISILRPTNPYAASKAAAEMFVLAYWHSFKLPIVIARSNNVYGPRQYPEKVVPKFILRLLKQKEPRMQGSGLQMRSFLFATDAANGIYSLHASGRPGVIYNIGVENEVTIVELASKLTRMITGTEITCFAKDSDRPFNDQRYPLDTEKITTEIGWRPKVAFEDGLQQTINWYRQVPYEKYWTQLPDDLFSN